MSGVPDRPEIFSTEDEREILAGRLRSAMERAWKNQLLISSTSAEWDHAAADVATGAVLRALRVMSARQLAVLLAWEANRHEEYVIHEPPRYAAEEIEGAAGGSPLTGTSTGGGSGREGGGGEPRRDGRT